MKELLSAFQGEIFRPLITLFVPGCIAISTWFVAILQREPTLAAIANTNRTETGIVLAIAIVFVGMIVEDWGSRIESSLLDKYVNWRTKNLFRQEWKQYLLLVYDSEPVVRSYLRGLLMRLKFELDSTAAFLMAGLGSLWLRVPDRWSVLLHWGPFIAAAYLLWEAYETHQLMGEKRHELLTGELRSVGVQGGSKAAPL